MLKFSAVRYFLLARHLEFWSSVLHDKDEPVSRDYIGSLTGFRKACNQLALKLSAKYIDECILPTFDDGQCPIGRDFGKLIETLIGRIEDELELTLFLYVPNTRAEFYEPKTPLFGAAVSDQFPSAITDIEEAGKCLALGRGTATVFHLMRVMEVGLKGLAKGLGIPYAPSWESYLKQIEIKITEKHAKKSKGWKKVESFYRDVSGDLQMVKIAWRNPTMHIVKSYTPEEAEDVFRAVRAFMKRISKQLTEKGPISKKKDDWLDEMTKP